MQPPHLDDWFGRHSGQFVRGFATGTIAGMDNLWVSTEVLGYLMSGKDCYTLAPVFVPRRA